MKQPFKVGRLTRSEPSNREDAQDWLYAMGEMPGLITAHIQPEGDQFVVVSLWQARDDKGREREDLPPLVEIVEGDGRPMDDPRVVQQAPILVYTTQISKWRAVKEKGVALIDTTVKSGLTMFAPTWDIVLGVKSGKITEAQYLEVYHRLMDDSVVSRKASWDKFINKYRGQAIALACYCPAGNFCHRHPLKKILFQQCALRGVKCEDMGEIS